MQLTPINLQAGQTTLNEACLNTLLPFEALAIIFDQVVNQKSPLVSDISSILLTCKKWKIVFENNPCIALAHLLTCRKMEIVFEKNLFIGPTQIGAPRQTSFQFEQSTFPQECLATSQKKYFTSQELKLIDLAYKNFPDLAILNFRKLLMIKSQLFCSNSLLLFLLDRYSWNPQDCKRSANKNIQQVAEKQLSILNSLVYGTDDQRLMMIKEGFIAELYRGGQEDLEEWDQAKNSIMFTLTKFPNFNDKKAIMQVVRCFGHSAFDILLWSIALKARQADAGDLSLQ